MVKVYIASKLKHYAKWQALRASRPDIEFTSRWFDCQHIGAEIEAQGYGSCSLSEQTAHDVWVIDEQDVQKAHVTICYAEAGEHLRGGLVEAGMAIGFGKSVIVVGKHPDYGTWQFHPVVFRVSSIEEALWKAKRLNI